MSVPRIAAIALLCLALPGCNATLTAYGNQSTAGGTTTTVTSSHVSGSTNFSGGRVSFSSGQPVPASAPGGHLRLSGSSAAAFVAGVALVDLLYYMVGPSRPKPLAPEAKIADTCSCYKKPVSSEQ